MKFINLILFICLSTLPALRVASANENFGAQGHTDEWLLVVGDGQNAKDEDLVKLRLALIKHQGKNQSTYSMLSATKDPWILINTGLPGGQQILKDVLSQDAFDWAQARRVESVGLRNDVFNSAQKQLTGNITLARLEGSYEVDKKFDLIVVKTLSGIVVLAKSEVFGDLSRFAVPGKDKKPSTRTETE